MRTVLTFVCLLVAYAARAFIIDFYVDGYMYMGSDRATEWDQEEWCFYARLETANALDCPKDKIIPLDERGTIAPPSYVENPDTGLGYTVYSVNLYSLTDESKTEEIILPESLVGIDLIAGFKNLKRIHMCDNVTYITMICDLPTLEELVLSSSLTELGSPGINLVGLRKLVLPESLKGLSYHSICNCFKLEELELRGVEVIHRDEISGLTALKKLVLSPKLKTVESGALATTAREIWFPSDGTNYGLTLKGDSFVCTPERIYCQHQTPPRVTKPYTAIFGGEEHRAIMTVYVPAESVEAYKAAPVFGEMNVVAYDFAAGVEMPMADEKPTEGRLYDLYGREISGPDITPGIYVRDGRKVIVR